MFPTLDDGSALEPEPPEFFGVKALRNPWFSLPFSVDLFYFDPATAKFTELHFQSKETEKLMERPLALDGMAIFFWW